MEAPQPGEVTGWVGVTGSDQREAWRQCGAPTRTSSHGFKGDERRKRRKKKEEDQGSYLIQRLRDSPTGGKLNRTFFILFSCATSKSHISQSSLTHMVKTHRGKWREQSNLKHLLSYLNKFHLH